MAYITPITDRTAADTINQTAKGFINVADWVRIYGNSVEVHTTVFLGIPEFNTIATPTTASIYTVSEVNTLCANIERMRLGMQTNYPALVAGEPLFVEVKDDWIGGQENLAPNFTNVNSWEKVLDIMWDVGPLPVYPGYRELESGFVRLLENGDTRILG